MDLAYNLMEWLSLIVVLVVLIISLIYRKKKHLFPIQLYIIASFIFTLFERIIIFFRKNGPNEIGGALLNIFSLLELSLLYYFLYLRIKGKGFRISMSIFLITYFTICIRFWTVQANSFFSFWPDLLGLEYLLIVIPCLFYIYEIFKSDLNTDFKANANFIITCGVLFYFSITIPYLFSYYNFYAIAPQFLTLSSLLNSIFYILLFMSFLKAYLCPIPDHKN
jgi:hypothetical protein